LKKGAGLPKKEKIKQRRIFQQLLLHGDSFIYKGIRFSFMAIPEVQKSEPFFPCVAFVVGRRHFKKAVQRNLLRRRMREAYRLQKNVLGGCAQYVLFIYVLRTVVEYEHIFSAIGGGVKLLKKRLIASREEKEKNELV